MFSITLTFTTWKACNQFFRSIRQVFSSFISTCIEKSLRHLMYLSYCSLRSDLSSHLSLMKDSEIEWDALFLLRVSKLCISDNKLVSFALYCFFALAPCWIQIPRMKALWAFHTTKGSATEFSFVEKNYRRCWQIALDATSSCKSLTLHCHKDLLRLSCSSIVTETRSWSDHLMPWIREEKFCEEATCLTQKGLFRSKYDVWSRRTYNPSR